MDRRKLGDTGIEVSALGLGTTKFGRNQGVKYPEGFEIPSEEHLADLLAQAKDLGINVIDTAPAYGTSEERLGRLLKGQREDWVIVGKVGEEFEGSVSSYNFTPEHFEMSVQRSLGRLQTDYIDVMLIHSDGSDMDILSDESVVQKMQDFKARGIVRAIGASTKTAEGGIKSLELMDCVMATYNPAYREEETVLDYAVVHNKGVFLKKVFSSGHDSNPDKALKFALSHAGVSSAVVGTISPQNMENNVRSLQTASRESS